MQAIYDRRGIQRFKYYDSKQRERWGDQSVEMKDRWISKPELDFLDDREKLTRFNNIELINDSGDPIYSECRDDH